MNNFSNQNIEQGNVNQPEPKQGKKIPSWIGFVIIVVSIIILFGGVFAYQYFFVKTQLSIQTQQTSASQTAGWKTYTNSEYGLEFRYPNNLFDFISSVAQKTCLKGSGDFFPYHQLFYGSHNGASTMSITILCQPTTKELISQSIKNNESLYKTSGYNASIISTIKINDYAAYEYTYSRIDTTATASGPYTRYNTEGHAIVVPREGYAIEIDFSSMRFISEEGKYISRGEYLVKEGGELSDPAKEALSTFKFINSTTARNLTSQDSKHNSEHIYIENNYSTVCGAMPWPKINNINDKNVLGKINQVVSFKNIIGITKQEDCVGFTGSDYQINYDKNNLLSISFFTSWMGAYPSESTINYVINLTNGEIVKPSDIFYQNKISDLVNFLNIKLQANIQQRLDSAKQQNPSGQGSLCSEEDVNPGLQMRKEYDPNYGKFTEQNLIASNNLNGQTSQYSSIKITSTGIEFIYDFGFAHVIKACEPNGVVVLDYSQLKGYIRLDSLLGNEIK